MEGLGINGYAEKVAHLDPDLRISTLPKRGRGWRPLFGQTGAAQSHLQNNEVGVGDLFLFFGWFRKTRRENGKIAFDGINDPVGKHLIFGYLHIGQVLRSGDSPEDWMEYHSHAQFIHNPCGEKHAIYVADEKLSFSPELKGGGNFLYNERSSNLLTLTRPETRRISEWNLPPEIFKKAKMTFHRKDKVWKEDFRGIYFQSALTHWQEAVVTDETGVVGKWAENLIFRLNLMNCIE
jgi:hypothetical protein